MGKCSHVQGLLFISFFLFCDALRMNDHNKKQASRDILVDTDDGENFYDSERAGNMISYLKTYNRNVTIMTAEYARLSNRNPIKFTFEKNPNKDKCLILYHIPKCGGTSLMQFFNSNKLRLWSHYGKLDANRPPPASDRGIGNISNADVYMGHFLPGFKQVLRDKYGMSRNCYEATVFRTPYERVSSALFFHHPNLTIHDYIQLMKKGPSPNTIEYFNDECRRFRNHPSGLFNMYEDAYHNDFQTKCSIPTAMERLSQLDVVLFTEEFHHITEVLSSIFELPLAKDPPVKNKSRNPGFKELPHELQALIESANEDDLDLFTRLVAAKSVLPGQ